jgi:hypothetical protein
MFAVEVDLRGFCLMLNNDPIVDELLMKVVLKGCQHVFSWDGHRTLQDHDVVGPMVSGRFLMSKSPVAESAAISS